MNSIIVVNLVEGFSVRFLHAWFLLHQGTDLPFMFDILEVGYLTYFGESLLRLKCFRSLVKVSQPVRNELSFGILSRWILRS